MQAGRSRAAPATPPSCSDSCSRGRLDPDFGPARGTRGPGREGLVTGLVTQVELDQNDLLAKGRAPETPGCRPAFQLPKGFPRCF